MPDILRLKTALWSLNVWTRDVEKPQARLSATLAARGKDLPETFLRFSPPLQITDIHVPQLEALVKPEPEQKLPIPLFFENRLYEFEFIFPEADRLKPEIVHWRNDVQDAFHRSGQSLRGSINTGNDTGWFRLGIRYTVAGTRIEQYISFEILPVKMDLAGDLDRIHAEIDATYPLWRFAFAGRTEQELAEARRPHERFPLLWLALFKKLRNDLDDAVKLVCRSPHARLLPQERFLRPDRIKGRLTPRLEEKITEQCRNGEAHRRHRIETRRLSVDTPENRFVKMVLERSSRELSNFVARARRNDRAPDQAKLSSAFYVELEGWRKPLEQRLMEPLFREVGDFNGLSRESLVLHHRAGYSKVYRIWQELKLYLDLFGRQASISMKSVAELYEIWCLLEIRRMLCSLGFEEVETRRPDLRTKGFEKELVDGMGTAFRFVRSDGMKIRLAHEPSYKSISEPKPSGIWSWTTPQKPDILLEATFAGKERIRWIFDAKYRITDGEDDTDLIPDDAINQMHRYRDALIHFERENERTAGQSRPVVGAFVLYPGFFDETGENPYRPGIDAVGIGGFPLLPGRENLWLRNFLREKLGSVPESYRVPDADEHLLHDSVRIPPTGLVLERYEDLTLVASLGHGRDRDYVERFKSGTAGWYHVPAKTTDDRKVPRALMREVKGCAIAVQVDGVAGRHVEYLYDVKSVNLVKRCELTIEQSGKVDPVSQKDYWLFALGESRRLPTLVTTDNEGRFLFRLTGTGDLLLAQKYESLPERYSSYNLHD
ncbi:MAG: DUF2357 domain-containing protein [Desulfuromonas sp.]|nr:DUF2357 domain-containing protein [Desulfuromonas sp.]